MWSRSIKAFIGIIFYAAIALVFVLQIHADSNEESKGYPPICEGLVSELVPEGLGQKIAGIHVPKDYFVPAVEDYRFGGKLLSSRVLNQCFWGSCVSASVLHVIEGINLAQHGVKIDFSLDHLIAVGLLQKAVQFADKLLDIPEQLAPILHNQYNQQTIRGWLKAEPLGGTTPVLNSSSLIMDGSWYPQVVTAIASYGLIPESAWTGRSFGKDTASDSRFLVQLHALQALLDHKATELMQNALSTAGSLNPEDSAEFAREVKRLKEWFVSSVYTLISAYLGTRLDFPFTFEGQIFEGPREFLKFNHALLNEGLIEYEEHQIGGLEQKAFDMIKASLEDRIPVLVGMDWPAINLFLDAGLFSDLHLGNFFSIPISHAEQVAALAQTHHLRFQMSRHMVLIVDYFENANERFLLVKNSWGRGAGAGGHLHLPYSVLTASKENTLLLYKKARFLNE